MIIDIIKRTALIEVRIGPRGRAGEDGGGASLPTGGTTGQVLAKVSNADGDADWISLGGAAALNVGTTSGTVCAGDDSRLSNSRAPSGSAGGVLAGTYPNPTFAADMATQAELDAGLATKADLVGGKVPSSQIPSIALTEFLGPVSSEAAMILLTGQPGDYCFRTDVGLAYFLTTGTGSSVGNWQAVSTPATSGVVSVNGQDGVVVLGKADIGLDQVDNTSDLDKPVSTAVQGQLDTKAGFDNPSFNNNLTIAGSEPFLMLQNTTGGQQKFLMNPAGSLNYTSPSESGVILTDASTIQGTQLADTTVTNAKLENSGITINGESVSLGGSITVAAEAGAYNTITGRPLFAATDANSTSSTTNLADLLSVSVNSVGAWGFFATGLCNGSVSGEGVTLAINGPTASAINGNISIPTNAASSLTNGAVTAWDSKVIATLAAVTPSWGRWTVSGRFVATATGTFAIRFAAETSGANSVNISAGATLQLFPL